jgi:alpha-beta hydrolase superfamily lysophospholipase
MVRRKNLLIGGAAVLAFEAARRIFRLTKVFCPTREPLQTWKPADYGIPSDRADEVWIETDDGARLYGWYLRAKNPIASTVYCHGNTGNLTNSAHVMPHLLDSGMNVLLFDYRGFGRSEGFATLRGVIADVLAVARFHDTIRPRNVPSVLYGYSLGGAIAAQAVHRHHFDGLILQSTFTSLPDVARVEFPRVPLHLLSGRVFDTKHAIERLRIPLLVIHGTSDETCPHWMGTAIFEACGSESKEMHVVDGGLHKDLWMRTPDDLVWTINRFVSGLSRLPRTRVEPVPLLERIIDSTFRYVRRHMREA